MNLRDAEVEGPVWGAVTSVWNAKTNAWTSTFALLTKTVKNSGTTGFRPLTAKESDLHASDPVTLFRDESVSGIDKLKRYYCLERTLGNIPDDAAKRHAAFFEWLSCNSL